MSICSNNNSLFGSSSQYIKTNGGDLVAVQGSNIMERLILNDIRIPYKQVLKSRIILKPGQTNFLLNHLGLGDNSTFLAIKVTYDPKSKLEEDNYINWSYFDDQTRVYPIGRLMILTGNSENRIKQIYLTNPNQNMPVSLDVMVGIYDDEYSYFNNNVQTGASFTGLEYTDIKTHVIGESIVFMDKSSTPLPLIYMYIHNIQGIERNSNVLIIDDVSYNSVFFQFLTEYDAIQALSLLSYVLENPNVDINTIDPIEDNVSPVIFFYSNLFNDNQYDYIYFNNEYDNVPYNTSLGYTFSSTIDINTTTYSYFNKSTIIDMFIDNIVDNRDGNLTINDSNVIINNDLQINDIYLSGTYSISFTFSDIANNDLSNINITLNII